MSRFFRRTERVVHPFDRQHGVDTSGLLYPDELATGTPADALTEGYYATAPSLFHGIVGLWRRTLQAAPLTSYAFVDLGCGKGRVLLLASLYPFRSITGIELHPDLARTARQNVAAWLRRPRACAAIDVVTGDALAAQVGWAPAGDVLGQAADVPVVLFMFNAFNAEAVRRLMGGLTAAAQSRTAPIDLVYLHPEQHAVVMEFAEAGGAASKSASKSAGRGAGVRLVADEEIAFSEEDTQADAFQVPSDRCAIYRIAEVQ